MEEEKVENTIVAIPASVTVKRFSEILELPVTTVIAELMKNKIMATINEEIDYETASIIADDLDFSPVPDVSVNDSDVVTLETLLDICKKEHENSDTLRPRPPIVTILGHVDHGKTTLLDTIRHASVADNEAGGITQHISAYQTKRRGKVITFIDTPGHAAFSSMRERGVSIADIAILVVAADDGVRPQTKEVITYLKEKKIPTILAINKIDRKEANVEKIKKELAENDFLIEEWGGDVIANEISAKNNTGIKDLLDSIVLLSEVKDFRADDKRDGLAVVLEARTDTKKGVVATVVVRTGTLKVGQDISAGGVHGRIRRIEDCSNKSIQSAGPSSTITLYGLNDVPGVNDIIQTMSGKQAARLKAQKNNSLKVRTKNIDSDVLANIPVIIKADVQGSLEAIEQILDTIPQKKVRIDYIRSGVGNITESDIKIAQGPNAIILGFNVTITAVARRLAEDYSVSIETFSIIYELVEHMKIALLDRIPQEIIRTDIGSVEIRGIFHTEKVRMVVGGYISTGFIEDGSLYEILRDETIIGTGSITSLQSNKMNTRKVEKSNECGITTKTTTRIKKGDVLSVYTEEVTDKSLD